MAEPVPVVLRPYLAPAVNRVLFVRGLPAKFTGDEVYTIFGEFGRLRQVRMGNEPATRGTAFVVYEDIYDAKSAVDQLGAGLQLTSHKFLEVRYFDEEKHKKGQERKKRRKEALADFQRKAEREAAAA